MKLPNNSYQLITTKKINKITKTQTILINGYDRKSFLISEIYLVNSYYTLFKLLQILTAINHILSFININILELQNILIPYDIFIRSVLVYRFIVFLKEY